MALAAEKVLIIGGGFSGMSAAIALSKVGVKVDLIEIDPNWRTDGAGITVSGPSLRAIESIGLLPKFLELGANFADVNMYDSAGNLLKSIASAKVPLSSITGSGGIMRPAFAKALGEATLASGVNVKLGVSYNDIVEGKDTIDVSFTDGSKQHYDLVIGADGVFSSVRKTYFPEAPEPRYTGQGAWRAVIPRFDVNSAMMFLGQKGKAGITPVSDTHMYLHYTERRQNKDRIDDNESLAHLQDLLEEFTAPTMLKIREALNSSSQIIYRPLEGMIMPRPWNRGRLQLIGDCVHATTPHLASGAGMGIEDGVVIADEIKKGGDLQTVLERYQNRRWERCRMIVANSLRLGEIEIEGGAPEEHTQIMGLSMAALLAPI